MLLLGWKKKEVFDVVLLRGHFYALSIHPYEPADEFIEKMEKALQGQGLKD
ncbi:MAG: hypothetical protein K2H85_08845 [Allobaculum sp.]|nr:hypothetical protein [Allobaculum sp.]